jgi:hypothetical protein
VNTENHNLKAANRCSENVAQFKYLGLTAGNQNLIQEKIKRRMNFDNTYRHSVQNLLSPHLWSKNVKIRIYKVIILPEALYVCKTWFLTLREVHRLRMAKTGC